MSVAKEGAAAKYGIKASRTTPESGLARHRVSPYFADQNAEGGMIVRAEWPGYVIDILVSVGQEVEEEEYLALLESTDSSHTQLYVMAPEAGRIKKVLIEEGDFVGEDDDLFEFSDIE